jgi:hypothetical protein
MPIQRCELPGGSQGWRWGAHGHCYATREEAEKQAEAAYAHGYAGDALAFDRATVRIIDTDGRLHVSITNISKATVNPYLGREIPGFDRLGLDPDRIYQLLRDPEELAKGAPTFNNIPLLSRHVPVSADDPRPELVVGSTGTDAEFVAPYLRNSLVVWDALAIAGIETGEQKELSCAYRYLPDMTPGLFEEMAYDGRMTQIIGNHIALVSAGRAGPDVVVSDHNPFVTPEKSNMKINRKTVAVRSALKAHLRPLMAQDAQPLNLNALVGAVSGATIAQDAARIAQDIKSKGKFTQELSADVLRLVVMDAAKDEDDEPTEDEEEDDEEEKKRKEEAARKKAEDEDEEEETKKDKEDDKKAMDAAIAAAVKKTETDTIARMNAIRQAEKDVQPIVGEVAAMDSAEAIYKFALDHAGIDTAGVHASAYATLVKMHITGQAKKPMIAQDAAASNSFWGQFPNAKLPKRA